MGPKGDARAYSRGKTESQGGGTAVAAAESSYPPTREPGRNPRQEQCAVDEARPHRPPPATPGWGAGYRLLRLSTDPLSPYLSPCLRSADPFSAAGTPRPAGPCGPDRSLLDVDRLESKMALQSVHVSVRSWQLRSPLVTVKWRFWAFKRS
jgi:hypothetical protein